MVVMPGATTLIGTRNGGLATFTCSELYTAMINGYLDIYRVYQTSNPESYCTLSGIGSVSDMECSDYTFTATTKSGRTLILHSHGFVIDRTRDDETPRYTIQHLPNAKELWGSYKNLKTTIDDRIIADCKFGGSASLYGLPFHMVLTSAYGLIMGTI